MDWNDLNHWGEKNKLHQGALDEDKYTNFRGGPSALAGGSNLSVNYMTSETSIWHDYPNTPDGILGYYNKVTNDLGVNVEFGDFDFGNPISIEVDGKLITQDLITTAEEIDVLSKNVDLSKVKTIIEIGVGYGRTMSYLLRKYSNIEKYYLLDISTARGLAYEYARNCLPDKLSLVEKISPQSSEKLKDKKIDLVISMSSMNEFPSDYVNYYLELIDSCAKYFYFKNGAGVEFTCPNPVYPHTYAKTGWIELYHSPSKTTNKMFDWIYKVNGS